MILPWLKESKVWKNDSNSYLLCIDFIFSLKGNTGDSGFSGNIGIYGAIGIKGQQGERGAPGLDGINGEVGLPGQRGDPGYLGKNFCLFKIIYYRIYI